MRKFLSFVLAIALIVCAVPFGAFSFDVSAATSGYYTYTASNGEATITYVDISISGDVTIPSKLGGYPVTSIGDEAFWGCTNLTGITIPDSVTSIGAYAFGFCEITSITIPDSVTSIGAWAFSACSSLTSVSIGDGVTSIVNDVFYECSSLTSVSLGDSVISIGSGAFCACTSLTSITIPDSVKSIGAWAFEYCTSLTSITIPDSVTSIGDNAFSSCDSLTIYGYTGSYAQSYANNNGIPFVVYEKPAYVVGDLSGDEKINNKDLGLLMQKLNGWDVAINEDAADVNADGKVNNKDYGLLMQYCNGWDVELK